MVKSIVPIGTKITFYKLYKKQGEFFIMDRIHSISLLFIRKS